MSGNWACFFRGWAHPATGGSLVQSKISFEPGGLDHASGTIPVPYSSKTVSILWRRTEAGIDYSLTVSSPVVLHVPGRPDPISDTAFSDFAGQHFRRHHYCLRDFTV
jgi:hypothetical protein